MSDWLNVLEYWPLLLTGLGTTLFLSAVSIVGSTIIGVLTGVGLASKSRLVRAPLAAYSAIFRGSPILIQLFMIYLGLAYLGVDIPVAAAAAIGFSLYGGAYIAEIVHSGITSVPSGQAEAASAFAFGRIATMTHVLLPQALRVMLPSITALWLGLIKDSSVASIIGYADLLNQGRTVIALTRAPFETYLLIALGYFIVCFPITLLVNRLERKSAAA